MKTSRAPPPPPVGQGTPSNPSNIGRAVLDMMQQNRGNPSPINSPPASTPPPPPPPRNAPVQNSGGTLRRAPPVPSTGNDFQPTDSTKSAARDYDHDFERRFRFTAIEHLPVPKPWTPPVATAK